ncbi:hypothetical protein [Prosthecobacter sp.]|uniref:hypothetical protein n=1 Tax=Prosthecobacter sp. TaxID=1965333 RepID=UPI002ABCBE69|nr:hypothetical protein [Prosthecobacter sp.]MDZ4404033.1 hypothetical protein [Prosthecobacter sp.]
MLALQERRWRGLARHALKTSPFYRRHMAGLDPDRCSLEDIPPLTKSMLIENWDEIVSEPCLRQAALEKHLENPANWNRLLHGRWMISHTSGTTGQSVIIPHDIESVDWLHAVHAARNGPANTASRPPCLNLFQRRPRLAAFIWGTAPSTSSALFHTRPWVGALFGSHHAINSGAAWDDILRQLNELQPDILICYASMLERLALSQLNGSLKLALSHPAASVSTGGDVLTPGIRALCRQAFNQEPLDGYGTGESPAIARQWHGMDRLMLLEDLTAFEAVDRDEKPVTEGEISDHVLVTPLINRAVPLLRYRLDDRVRIGPVQPGWPFRSIAEILGRTTMTFAYHIPEERVVVGMNVFGIYETDPRVINWQARQTGPASIECVFTIFPGVDVAKLTAEILANMRQHLDSCACHQVTCAAKCVPSIEADPRTGKVNQFVPLPAKVRSAS